MAMRNAITGRREINDLSNRTFGHLNVIRLKEVRDHVTIWECRCSCGKIIERTGKSFYPAQKGVDVGAHGCGCDHVFFIRNFYPNVLKTKGCWIWKGYCERNGYGRIHRRKGVRLSAHRVSFELHKGKIPVGLFVCHRCDNPACVRPDHLFLGTSDDNISDMVKKKRHIYGERHHRSKITISIAREIRDAWVPGVVTLQFLADKYRLSFSQIRNIVHGKQWMHIEG